MTKLSIIPIVVMLSLAGCIQNMSDLKDRVGAGDEPIETAALEEPTPTVDTPTNKTPPKAPVARLSLFAQNGAMLYKSSFIADDPTEIVFVDEETKLKALASDSETNEPGANLTTFAWTLQGKPLPSGRSVDVEVGEAGIYTLTLVVTDSNGMTDAHTLRLGVAPVPVEVATTLKTGPVAGAGGAGQNGELVFDLAADGAGVPATIQSVTFEAAASATCDHILEVIGPDGTSLGVKDSAGNGAPETINAGALEPGAYEIIVSGFACAAPEVDVIVTVVYLPIVEGLEAGDGHGHAH